MKALRVATIVFAVAAISAIASAPAFAQVDQDIKEGDELFDRGGEKNLKKAAKKYDRAIKKSPSLVSPEAYAKRAAIYFLLKKYDAGLRFIDGKALKQHPGASEVLEYKALILWALKKPEDAIEVADKVAASAPSSYQAQLLRGTYYFGRDPATAASAFDNYLKYRPGALADRDGMPRLKLGLAYLTVNEPEKAEKQFEIASKQFRKKKSIVINAQNGLCAAYSANGKYDQAITVCEKITDNRKHIDRKGSAWYNLGRAYLEKKQPTKARQAGLEYIQYNQSSPKGYVLLGDAYFEERKYQEALQYFKEAEKRGDRSTDNLLKMGRSYRELDDPDSALVRLEAAAATEPGSVPIAVELGEVYLHPKIRADAKAFGAVSKLIKTELTPEQEDDVRFIAGRALYNQGKLAQAKVHFLRAHTLAPKDVKYRDGLVDTINGQAFEAYGKKDRRKTLVFLKEAHGYDTASAVTNLNLAVVSIEDGQCDDAHGYLKPLLKKGKNRVTAQRLKARAYMCQKKPDTKKAVEYYERAAKGASNNKLLQAEIYTEWAPLIAKADLADALDKLETADQIASTNPALQKAIQRNLALLKFRRGWELMRSRSPDKAVAEFERSMRNPGVLKGTEELAFEFSLALAYLESGQTTEASKIFSKLAKKGGEGKYLKAPYDKVGADFFSAYADYRTNNIKSRRRAESEFTKMQRGAKGKFASKLRELIGSANEYIAYAEYRSGKASSAGKALSTAAKYATSAQQKRLIDHNRAVLGMKSVNPAVFAKMGGNPPESIINLGVAYDRAGDPKKAYDAWVQAKSKGARAPDLDKWIAAKRRIFGYK